MVFISCNLPHGFSSSVAVKLYYKLREYGSSVQGIYLCSEAAELGVEGIVCAQQFLMVEST